MKIFVIFLFMCRFGYAQPGVTEPFMYPGISRDSLNLEFTRKFCSEVMGMDSLAIEDHIDDIVSANGPSNMFKSGDNDSSIVGMLKDIFFDPAVRFEIGAKNPRIFDLVVFEETFFNNGYSDEIDVDYLTYSDFIADLGYFDTIKCHVKYFIQDYTDYFVENVQLFAKDGTFLIRISFRYTDGFNIESIEVGVVK